MRLIIALNVTEKADKPLFMHGKISNYELVNFKNTNGNLTLNFKKLNISTKNHFNRSSIRVKW